MVSIKKDNRYRVYYGMKNRCYNSNYHCYKNYGGRGIIVCDRWLGDNGFKNFCNDMGDRTELMTLDRIDVNGNYEPNNCRWLSIYKQASNRTNSNKIVGVSRNKCGYQAYLMHKGISYFKRFNTEIEAIQYRKKLEEQFMF